MIRAIRQADSNPIYRLEHRYHDHRRAARKRRWWRLILGFLVYGEALFISLVIFGGELIGALLQRDPTPINETLGFLMFPAFFVTLFFHSGLLMSTLIAGVEGLAREHRNNCWELLLLTGMDARRLVWGKWWATLRSMLRGYLWLIPLRIGLVVWLSATTSRSFVPYLASFGGNYRIIQPTPLEILLIAPVIAAFTVAGAALATSIGLAAAVSFRRATPAVVTAIISSIFLLPATAFILGFAGNLLGRAASADFYPSAFIQGVIGWGAMTFVGNGYLLTYPLAEYTLISSDFPAASRVNANDAIMIILATLIGLAAYALTIWIMLRLAQRRLIRRGVSAPNKMKSTHPTIQGHRFKTRIRVMRGHNDS